MRNVSAVVLPGHEAHFTNADGEAIRATDLDGKVMIPSDQFGELEALGSVVRAPRDPLDHDSDGRSGFNHAGAAAAVKEAEKK